MKYCEKNYVFEDDEDIECIKINNLLNQENMNMKELNIRNILPKLYNRKLENLGKLIIK